MIMKLLQGVLNIFLAPILGLLSFAIDLDAVGSFILQVLGYMRQGMAIINFFCPLSLVMPCLVTVVAVYAVLQLYHLVMFVLRKIPFTGIE